MDGPNVEGAQKTLMEKLLKPRPSTYASLFQLSGGPTYLEILIFSTLLSTNYGMANHTEIKAVIVIGWKKFWRSKFPSHGRKPEEMVSA